jgi:membrane protein
MAHIFQPTARLSLLQLLSGLVHDVSALMQQEWAVAKHEVQGTLRTVQTAISLLSLGTGLAGIGGLLPIILMAYLLHTLTDMARWECYGLMGGVFALIGGILLGMDNAQLTHVSVFPPHTLETLQAHLASRTGRDSTQRSGVAETPSRQEAAQTPDSSKKVKEVWGLGGLSAKELGRRVLHEIQHDDCFGRAAQLTYYFLFALFPFFLVLTTLLGYLPVPNLLDRLMEVVAQMLPGDALRLVQENVRDLVVNQRGGLLSFGILAALWTSSSAITAIMDGLNRAYDVEEGRPFWKVRAYAILLTIGLSLFIIVSIILLTFGPQIGGWIADRVGLGGIFQTAWNLLRWPVIVGLIILAMALVYYVAPDVEQEWQWITPGSIVAVIGWLLASLGFSYYVNNFGSYNATYGSIGAVIVLLTWMYVSGFFVLVGGEINSEIEHAAASGKDPGEKQLPST